MYLSHEKPEEIDLCCFTVNYRQYATPGHIITSSVDQPIKTPSLQCHTVGNHIRAVSFHSSFFHSLLFTPDMSRNASISAILTVLVLNEFTARIPMVCGNYAQKNYVH